MLVPLFPLLWLFFCYSFLGWVLETAVSAVRLHRYVDRSVLFGPLCACYGITAVLLTVGLPELRGNYFFLFLGSAICSTVVEWIAGHLLEKATHTRWWDYSNRRGNLDGYICVGAFLLWGVLGLAAVQWINPLLLALYRWLPPLVGEILLWVLLALLAADIAGTVLTLCGVRSSLPPLENLNSRLAALSVRLGEWILRRAEGRIQKAHPGAVFSRRRERTTVSPFARGASFYSILLLFFIGGVAGDLAETIFCRLKMGWWMSRSSVVWGPFSIVWGLALAAATLFLYKYRDRSASFFFVAGTLLGGLYEYLCSVFTELVFGTVFWDYSAIPLTWAGASTCCTASSGASPRWPGSGGSTPSWPAGSPRFHRAPGKRWSGCSSPSCPSIWRSAAWPWHATAPGPPESPPTRPGSSTWMPTTVTT